MPAETSRGEAPGRASGRRAGPQRIIIKVSPGAEVSPPAAFLGGTRPRRGSPEPAEARSARPGGGTGSPEPGPARPSGALKKPLTCPEAACNIPSRLRPDSCVRPHAPKRSRRAPRPPLPAVPGRRPSAGPRVRTPEGRRIKILQLPGGSPTGVSGLPGDPLFFRRRLPSPVSPCGKSPLLCYSD